MTTEAIITERILAELEKGVAPWHRPWFGTLDGPISHATGKPYSLLNQILLGDVPSEFVTFKQAKAEGGAPKKGSKGKLVTFWKRIQVSGVATDEDADGEAEAATGRGRVIPFLRYYTVFDIADCDGIAPKFPDREAVAHEPSAEGEAVVDGYFSQDGAPALDRDHKSNRAFYSPALDSVTVPRIDQFPELAEFYSTLFHEMIHSTGHASRLDRFTGKDAHFGSDDYSREELVAEIGAAALLHRIGLETPATFKNSAAYVDSWSKALRADSKLFTTACARAEKAVRWILGEKPEEKPEPAPEPAPAVVAVPGPEQMTLALF